MTRTAVSRSGFPALLPLALSMAMAGLAGCVTTSEGPEFTAGTVDLSFPRSRHLLERGEYHNVFIMTESPSPSDYAPPPAMRSSGQKEILDFGLDHRLEFYNQAFHVGGKDRYPAGDDSILYVFLEVEGDWSFVYRGVEFVIQRPGRWKPAVLHRRVYARGPSTTLAGPPSAVEGRYRVQQGSRPRRFTSQKKQLVSEELKVSTHLIQFENSQPSFLRVNGLTVPIRAGQRVTIDRLGNPEVLGS